jgi:hypothetical protein
MRVMLGKLVHDRSESVGFIPHRGKGRRGHVCGRDQEGDPGVRVVEVPGVQVERCRVGQGMSKRVSNLHGSSAVNVSTESFLEYTSGIGRKTASPHLILLAKSCRHWYDTSASW